MTHAKTPEGRTKAAVKAVLKKHGIWYFLPVSNGMGAHGIPDILACLDGRLLAIEAKAEDGMQPTPLQQVQLERIAAAGGLTFLATPSTVELLDSMIATFKAKHRFVR